MVEIKNLIKEQLELKEKEFNLQKYEKISERFHLSVEPFSVANGLLN